MTKRPREAETHKCEVELVEEGVEDVEQRVLREMVPLGVFRVITAGDLQLGMKWNEVEQGRMPIRCGVKSLSLLHSHTMGFIELHHVVKMEPSRMFYNVLLQ